MSSGNEKYLSECPARRMTFLESTKSCPILEINIMVIICISTVIEQNLKYRRIDFNRVITLTNATWILPCVLQMDLTDLSMNHNEYSVARIPLAEKDRSNAENNSV